MVVLVVEVVAEFSLVVIIADLDKKV